MLFPLLFSGLFALGCDWLAVGLFRGWNPEQQQQRADQFARQANLALPPSLVATVAARLRRRQLAALLVTALPSAAICGMIGLNFGDGLSGPVSQLWGLLPLAAVGVTAGVGLPIGHLYDLRAAGRAGGPRTARITGARLGDVVPPLLTWGVRLFALVPALTIALTGWSWPPQRLSHWTTALLVAATALPVAAVVECFQRRIIAGPQRASGPQSIGFDDAFRAEAARQLMALSTSYSLLLLLAVTALEPGGNTWSLSTVTVLVPGLAGFFALQTVTQLPWVQRYYHRQYRRPETVGYGAPC